VSWKRKDLLGLEELSREEMEEILSLARSYKEKAPGDELRGLRVANLFFEASTRTANSFKIAAWNLGAEVLDFSPETSSLKKGESLLDTARNIAAMGVRAMVVRHPSAGAPWMLARELPKVSVLNGGDGAHEHPTQAFLDMMTLIEARGSLDGVSVGIVGDIAHSRVARSDIWGMAKCGAKVYVCGPRTMMPPSLEGLPVEPVYDLDDLLPRLDAVIMLRIQLERQGRPLIPSLSEYAKAYGLNSERLKRAGDDIVIMHPGPTNRGVEITPEVADGPDPVILRQVENGVYVRMAALRLCTGAPS